MILPVLSNIAQYYFDFFIYENLTHIIRLRIILIISSHHMFLIYYHKTLSKYFQTGPNTYTYIYYLFALLLPGIKSNADIPSSKAYWFSNL